MNTVIKELIEKRKRDFDRVLEFFKSETTSIKSGRATPAMVENIEVELYNQKLKIKELASITVPEPKTLIIQPWDKNSMGAIEGVIRKSGFGFNPVVDGQVVRINIPSLTQEQRRKFVEVLKRKTEEARVKIRRIREEIWDKIQALEHSHQIRQDDKFRAKEDLQKTVDRYNSEIQNLENKKEKELAS